MWIRDVDNNLLNLALCFKVEVQESYGDDSSHEVVAKMQVLNTCEDHPLLRGSEMECRKWRTELHARLNGFDLDSVT